MPRQHEHHVPGLGRDPRAAAHQRRPADLRHAGVRPPGQGRRIEISGPAPNGYVRGSAAAAGSPVFNGPVRQPAEHLPVPTSNTRLRAAADCPVRVLRQDRRSRSTARARWTCDGATRQQPRHTTTHMRTARRTASSTWTTTARARSTAPREHRLQRLRQWLRGPDGRARHVPEVDDARLGATTSSIDGDLEADRPATRCSGLIAQRFVRVKHDVRRRRAADNVGSGTLTNITVEAAILALNDSFIVDNWRVRRRARDADGDGAIAQRFRGPVGTFSGATRETRLREELQVRRPAALPQPAVLPGSDPAAWRVVRANEQVPAAP